MLSLEREIKEFFMLGIKDAIKRIYSGEDALVKHIMLFVLTGVPVMLSTPLNEISKRGSITAMDFWMSLAALVIMAVISIYLGGYIYGIIHNSFDDSKENILPDFDKSWFKIFFKGLPLQICWVLYIFAIFLVAFALKVGLLFVLSPAASTVVASVLFLTVSAFIFLMLPFVFTIFSKEYKRDGLYAFNILFKYFNKTIKSVLWLIVKAIPIFLLASVISVLGYGDNVVAYLLSALGAYLLTMVQYVVSFCYVQIYREKLETVE